MDSFMFLAPCIVISLWNINQRKAYFSNRYFFSVFQLLTFSPCFEPHGFFVREKAVKRRFVLYVTCIGVSSLAGGRVCSVSIELYNCILEDEPMREDVKT